MFMAGTSPAMTTCVNLRCFTAPRNDGRRSILRVAAIVALAAIRLPVSRPAIDRCRLRREAGAIVIARLPLGLLAVSLLTVGLLAVGLAISPLLSVSRLLPVSLLAVVLAVAALAGVRRLLAIPRLAITRRLLRRLAACDQRAARRDVATHDHGRAAHALGLDHVVQHRGIGRRQPHAAVRHRHAEMRRIGEAVDGVT